MVALLTQNKSNISGAVRFSDSETLVIPGAPQTLHQETISVGSETDLHTLKVDSTTYGIFRVLLRLDGGTPIDDEIIGSGQTGPGLNNVMFWNGGRTIKEKETYFVVYSSFSDSAQTNVRAHLMVSDR